MTISGDRPLPMCDRCWTVTTWDSAGNEQVGTCGHGCRCGCHTEGGEA